MLELGIRFDMRYPAWASAERNDLYRAAREMAQFADELGFHALLIGEHHGTDDGYTSAPFVAAASFAARTVSMRVRMRAVLLPLHDPIDIAEQLLTLDVLTDGRAEAVLGLGHVPTEFEMFGIDVKTRVSRLERGAAVLRAAIGGQDLESIGLTGRVTPLPVQEQLPLYLGGGVLASARRAARLGLGFAPHIADSALLSEYEAECARLGQEPGPVIPNPGHYAVFVADDPEQFWETLAPHARHNANEYTRMGRQGGGASPFDTVIARGTVESVRSDPNCLVLTPDECIDMARRAAERDASLQFVPLLGGLGPEHGWASLRLFAARVLPILKRERLLTHRPGRTATV
jgi:alkanesulfonate monooxygenase SsuD/methylene tetrahydromethanopterin reductase-like flavin-dependent oxidoreductase (luciferase family)